MTLTIGSLLVVSAVSATRSLASARAKVDRRVERSMAARHAMETIVAALRNIRKDPTQRFPVVVGHSGGQGAGNDRIDVLVISDQRARPDGPESDQYEVGFYLMQQSGQQWPTLMRRRDHALDEHPEEGGIATVVAEGIVGLSFEYYADDQWMTEWPADQPRTPKAVRVTVEAAAAPAEPGLSPQTIQLSTVVPLCVNKTDTTAKTEKTGKPGAPPEERQTRD